MTAVNEALMGRLTERQCWNTGTHVVLAGESIPHDHAPSREDLLREAARIEAYGSTSRDGICRHGVWVGGSGIDWMCGRCEQSSLTEEVADLRAAAEEVR